jgi:hypothetical protein
MLFDRGVTPGRSLFQLFRAGIPVKIPARFIDRGGRLAAVTP